MGRFVRVLGPCFRGVLKMALGGMGCGEVGGVVFSEEFCTDTRLRLYERYRTFPL